MARIEPELARVWTRLLTTAHLLRSEPVLAVMPETLVIR